MGLKLHVHVIEARNLSAKDSNGLSDPFVRLQLGSQKAKSTIVSKNLNPTWNEEFFFLVEDMLTDILQVSVWDQDFLKADFLGHVNIPVAQVSNGEQRSLPPTWYPLQQRSAKQPVSGDIYLGLMLLGRDDSATLRRSESPILNRNGSELASSDWSSSAPSSPLPVGRSSQLAKLPSSDSDASVETISTTVSTTVSTVSTVSRSLTPTRSSHRVSYASSVTSDETSQRGHSSKNIFRGLRHMAHGGLNRKNTAKPLLEKSVSSGTSFTTASLGNIDSPNQSEILPATFWMDDGVQEVGTGLAGMPPPYAGGVVLDKVYNVTARKLTAILFQPGSVFQDDLAEASKKVKVDDGEWLRASEDRAIRTVTYMTAPSTLIKSVKATEVQVYSQIDVGKYIVEISVQTPDVPYGNTFRSEVQFVIAAGTAAESAHLRVSWRANFVQSTIMKGMIEKGMGQGIRESYELFGKILSQHAPLLSLSSSAAPPQVERPKTMVDKALGVIQVAHTWLSPLLIGVLLAHLFVANRHTYQGIEVLGIDLPDSISELIFAAIVVIYIEHTSIMLWKLLQARLLQTGDHGVRAKGNGWLVTVTLLEGSSLGTDAGRLFDPYVVFTCNGKNRTSSVKLQTLNPLWNEILEFDAMDDAPSTLEVEVFDYDGPFSEPESLGRAEVSFLKTSPKDLENLFIPLEGRRARAAGSHIRLRVFLTNTNEAAEVLPGIIEKVQKEVGRKIERRSPQKNAAFQKLFSLPDHEFLINDYSAAIKKTFLVQGRVFLSPRTMGFYSNLFGHKTKFTLLWEDIDDIKENMKPIDRMLNPSITVYLRKGRGSDARSGSYGVDPHGRLKFRFQSFVRPGQAFRTILVLWKNRTLTPDQQIAKVEEMEAKEPVLTNSSSHSQSDDDDSIISIDEPQMVEASTLEIPITVQAFLKMMDDPALEQRMATELDLHNYKATPWEPLEEKPDVFRREQRYSFSRRVCPFGSAVTVVQQRTCAKDFSWARLEENMTLHNVPFGDHFQVEIRREIMAKSGEMSLDRALVGVSWIKKTKCKKRMEKSILRHSTKNVKRSVDFLVKEVIAHTESGLS